jgi:hypothetical protein
MKAALDTNASEAGSKHREPCTDDPAAKFLTAVRAPIGASLKHGKHIDGEQDRHRTADIAMVNWGNTLLKSRVEFEPALIILEVGRAP